MVLGYGNKFNFYVMRFWWCQCMMPVFAFFENLEIFITLVPGVRLMRSSNCWKANLAYFNLKIFLVSKFQLYDAWTRVRCASSYVVFWSVCKCIIIACYIVGLLLLHVLAGVWCIMASSGEVHRLWWMYLCVLLCCMHNMCKFGV